MTKTITRIGNSQGIIFDAALMDIAGLKVTPKSWPLTEGRPACRTKGCWNPRWQRRRPR